MFLAPPPPPPPPPPPAASAVAQAASVEFDFEQHVRDHVWHLNEETSRNDNKFRVVVCKHWLVGLCSIGEENCTFLHRYDKNKSAPCKHGMLCKIKNCPMKHVEEQEKAECLFFKQGFCFNGPACQRRHVKRAREELPLDANFESCVTNDKNKKFDQEGGGFQPIKKQTIINDNFKVTLCSNWLQNGSCDFNDRCHFAHGEEEINDSPQGGPETLDLTTIYDPTRFVMITDPPKFPFQHNTGKCSFFLFQVPDLRSLEVSRRRGIWALPVRMAADINSALKSSDHVVAFLVVRSMRALYGTIKIGGAIPPAQPGSPLTPEFPVSWLRINRVALRTVSQLKIGAGYFVGKTTYDTKLDPKTGSDIMTIMYRKPEWDWTKEFQLAAVPALDSTETQAYIDAMTVSDPDQLFNANWIEKISSASQQNFHERPRFPPKNQYGAPAVDPSEPQQFYTGDNPGFVFCANNSQIVFEMLHRKLFGVPANMRDIIIHLNAPLFLFDCSTNCLMGIFQAETPVSENIDPTAFAMFGQPSQLPIQLRFKIVLEAPFVNVADPQVMTIFAESGGPPMGPIGLKETKALANLFATRAGSQFPAMGGAGGGGGGAASGAQAGGAWMGGRQPPAMGMGMGTGGAMGGAKPGMYRPPFKNVEVVPIDIQASIVAVKRAVLGNDASNVMEIVERRGSKQTVRIRMRGIMSGYKEGPTEMELQEPLHFNVSAESEELLALVVSDVRNLVERARSEVGHR